MITIAVRALRNVATFFEAYQHPKDLGNRAAELACHVAFCESRRLAGKKLQYIQAFLKSWSRVPAGSLGRLCLHKCRIHVWVNGKCQSCWLVSTNLLQHWSVCQPDRHSPPESLK